MGQSAPISDSSGARPESVNPAFVNLVKDDMQAVDRVIIRRLRSDVALVGELGRHIINSGGKRLRPILAILAARACGYRGDKHIQIAAIIEFIHTATLLHDDVVDASAMRRGKDTANAIWGNEASVLVGDFLYSRAFQMMVDIDRMRVMDILAETTNTIAEGEVMQLMSRNNPRTAEREYMRVIEAKTAKLFEAAARLGAVLCGREDVEDALAGYGMCLGRAFQLIDDALDYTAASAREIGKNIGDDLSEGKPTLPLIRAMQVAPAAKAQIIRHAIENGGIDNIGAVLGVINETDSIAYTRRLARDQADCAVGHLDRLGDNAYRAALAELADFAVRRSF